MREIASEITSFVVQNVIKGWCASSMQLKCFTYVVKFLNIGHVLIEFTSVQLIYSIETNFINKTG